MTEPQLTTLHAPMRIAGISKRTRLENVHETLSQLWQEWENHKASRLPSFTLTVYCVYQYFDDAPDEVQITLGRIIAQDLKLPEWASEVTLPAQDYMRFDVPDSLPKDLFNTWQKIENNDNLNRSFTIDFETHSYNTLPRIYIGIVS
jgi:hypothetical protein